MVPARVTESLTAIFSTHTSVFWQDVDGEFASDIDTLSLNDVNVVHLDRTPALAIKIDIESSPRARRLLYSARPEPDPAHDWLLDVRLRAKSFRADSTSILIEDLGLESLMLAPHLKLRQKFFQANERLERLKRLVLPGETADAIDRKMMAVLLRSDEADPLALTMRLLHGLWVKGETTVGEAPKAWSDLAANDLDNAFWSMAKETFGYEAEEPSLSDLLLRLLVTDFVRSISAPCPPALKHLVLEHRQLSANASVLAARWRADLNMFASYGDLSAAVAKTLNLPEHIETLSAEFLSECVTFFAVDQQIVRDLKTRVTAQGGAVLDSIRPIIARRRDAHWVNRAMAGANDQTRAMAACYDAIEAAAEFLALKDRHSAGLSFVDAAEAAQRYRTDLFAFDQLYRRFHFAVGEVEPMGWGLLKTLTDTIESSYSGWFIPQLASAWQKVLEGPSGLLQNWRIDGLPAQQSFFNEKVVPTLKSVKRIFVIISDAFRFEVAEQLTREINSKNRLTATLDAMLGVLPSYTSLGMAALLPHQTLSYRANANTDVCVDGQLVSTTQARSSQLAKSGGVAIKADDLVALGKEKGRELVKDKRVVYVYHDRIDMIGDKQASEDQTFRAASETLVDLQQVISFIANNLNGSTILVTADHGFMYQVSALDEADKAALSEQPPGTLRAKKRYLLGVDLPKTDKAWHGNTAITAGTEKGDGSLDFWVPKGAMRFHFAGGARFVHGSAMPQEVIVPLITVRLNESDKAKTRQVDISLLGSSNKVVTNTQRFEFIQTEAVSERVLPRSVVISLRDGDAPISNEQTVTFDSASSSLNDRVRSVFLTMQSGDYDRQRDYVLIARDVQSKVEVLRTPVRIDLTISNDF